MKKRKKSSSLLSLGKVSYKWVSLKVFLDLLLVVSTVVFIDRVSWFIVTLYNNLLTNRNIIINVGIIFGVLISKIGIPIITSRVMHKISSEIKNKTREQIYSKLLELEIESVSEKKTGAILSTAVEGVESLEVFYGLFFPQIFLSVLVPIGLFIYLQFFDQIIAWVLLAAVPLIPISVGLVAAWVRRVSKMHWSTYEDLNSFFLESIQGITTLKAFGLVSRRKEKISKKSWDFRNKTMKLLYANLASILTMDIIAMVGTALGITLAIVRFQTFGLQVALIVLLIAYEFFRPLRQLGSYFHFAVNGISASKSIIDLYNKETKKRRSDYSLVLNQKKQLPVVFQDVYFSYDDRTAEILKGISFTAEAGKITAIVGNSGSGKTTLVNLIVRFFDPLAGTIYLGNTDLSKVKTEEIRQNVSYLSQRTTLFYGSIKENLLIAKPNATEEELVSACIKAGIMDYIQTLPERFDSHLEEHARNLSTGQVQRIGIARVLLKDAPILILDEPTANIDSENEEKIRETIHTISKTKTTILISHNLRTVKQADVIFILSDGVMKEYGTHEELITKEESQYKHMVNSQLSATGIKAGIENYTAK
jgi:ATP-binding cassette subfamily C protein